MKKMITDLYLFAEKTTILSTSIRSPPHSTDNLVIPPC